RRTGHGNAGGADRRFGDLARPRVADHGAHDLHRLGRHLHADAVAGQNRDLHGAAPSAVAISAARRAPRTGMLATSTRSRRLQVSCVIGPSPSSVGTPRAAAKLPSEPPGETTSWIGAPSSAQMAFAASNRRMVPARVGKGGR